MAEKRTRRRFAAERRMLLPKRPARPGADALREKPRRRGGGCGRTEPAYRDRRARSHADPGLGLVLLPPGRTAWPTG
jgi:hypothetical protein